MKLLTLHETARRLRVHNNTAYGWVRTGVLPATKIGGLWRISSTGLEQFLRGRSSRLEADHDTRHT